LTDTAEKLAELTELTLNLAKELVHLAHSTDDGVIMVKALSLALGHAISNAPDEVRERVKLAAFLQIERTIQETVDMGLAGRGSLVQ
jgi:hypothetical protein